MSQKILVFSFYLLFFLTPLIWTPYNYELFEYNKMMFVYALTVVIAGTWLIKIVNSRSLIINLTPLGIPLLLFLGANIISTIFSIDPHTSWWGYYSRSNGGLLSIISYTLLYFALVSNFDSTYVKKFLNAALFGGLIVALYAIPEHFGISPSCVILNGNFTANCWIQDVQARVFATLGQPNWLAAYLAMLIFPALFFYLTAKTFLKRTTYYLLLTAYYLAFTFTYSRGATLGFLAGTGMFIVFNLPRLHLEGVKLNLINKLRPVFILLLTFLFINLLFGSTLTRFKLFTQSIPTQKPSSTAQVTQLESGGTESGQIRLIVWKGALEIFKAYPIFGSGVETFAYSYYNFRPVAHNLVSEWDFLYNKAHNEYLNYLANTGAVGSISYMALIFAFIVWSIKKIIGAKNSSLYILHSALLASYVSYLVQNFFGFSVVVIAMFFYLFPALSFASSEPVKNIEFSLKILSIRLVRTILIIIFIFTIVFSLFNIFKLWLADTLFARGTNYSTAGNPGKAYNELIDAVFFNPVEPLYKNELGYAAATAAISLFSEDATLSSKLKNLAASETENSLYLSPRNISLIRTAIRTYYALSGIDPQYNQRTIDALDKAIFYAPTDPKLYYNKALVLGQLEKLKEGVAVLQKAIELKPNYRDAHYTLGVYYEALGEKGNAIKQMNIVLKLIPNDPDALKKLEELQ